MADEIVIPDKPAFKAAEVCELLKLQPYVLKSWENEFKDLGVSKTAGGPRVYRRVDVERAVRIRELMLREGLTLAGVRRRLEQDAATSGVEEELIAELASAAAPVSAPPAPAVRPEDRERVEKVKHGLRALLESLSRPAAAQASPAQSQQSSESTFPLADDPAAAATPAPASKARRGRPKPPAEPSPLPRVAEQDESPAPPVAAVQVDEAEPGDPPAPAPPRELTVVVDDAPSLFGDDEPVVARDADQGGRPKGKKRAPRAPDSLSE